MEPKNIALVIVAAVLVIILVVLLVAITKHWKRVNRKKEVKTAATSGISAEIIKAMGGLNNITEVSNKMSRLYITLDKSENADVKLLNSVGLTEAIVMEQKIVIVIGDQAKSISEEINILLQAKSN